MPIATITVELEIPGAHSLKERRHAVRSIKDKLRHSFNISVAELDEGTIWNRATLGIAAISASTSYLTGQCEQVERAVYSYSNKLGVTVTEIYAEIVEQESLDVASGE
ncbi:hypothetical protein HDF16_000496 [Granulicella aggregans]|uniref:DUF503 domain-containing protein n=1 Tax=Granulicella aggregans TaxID=474949 RepID=A0A7W7Z9V8_9BACT|nr:DUF503 domain-containing protein [Granulicella aggregans]MBB5055827.1 hypothetical protein [Granulicella aggregans]